MAHCSEEEADVAAAGIDLVNACNAKEVAECVFSLAEEALAECESEHGT